MKPYQGTNSLNFKSNITPRITVMSAKVLQLTYVPNCVMRSYNVSSSALHPKLVNNSCDR